MNSNRVEQRIKSPHKADQSTLVMQEDLNRMLRGHINTWQLPISCSKCCIFYLRSLLTWYRIRPILSRTVYYLLYRNL